MDDDAAVRDSLRALLESAGYAVRDFDTTKALLDSPTIGNGYCVVADIRMPDMDGLTLQQELIKRQIALPVIIVTGHGDVPLAVRAMKAGAVDFIEKPFDEQVILDSVQKALVLARETRDQATLTKDAESRIAVSPRANARCWHILSSDVPIR